MTLLEEYLQILGGNAIVLKEIETNELFKIVSNLDDVTAVSFNTWLFDIDSKLVIEFYHDEEIILSQ